MVIVWLSLCMVAENTCWSQVSESFHSFMKHRYAGIWPGRPSLFAGASWALPCSPIRCLDVSYTPREAKLAHVVVLSFLWCYLFLSKGKWNTWICAEEQNLKCKCPFFCLIRACRDYRIWNENWEYFDNWSWNVDGLTIQVNNLPINE